MALTLFDATVAPCVRTLTNLIAVLQKGEAHATARKIDPAVLLGTRLFPDMLPLTMQIVIAGDIAGGGAARLAGVAVPTFETGKSSFSELIHGVRQTIAYLETLQPDQFIGAEDRTVTWSTRTSTKNMQGLPYLFNHVLPNVFFHTATAYDILRHCGVELGKQDFLGRT